ncbi:MAG TPA: aromatic ring-hydroxylating dioxygenase subunit alpha [Segeticoccus sp.]|uniref:aromatic ring-hydroxylating oxygenase subunit alpha n=1 Tax=Segeticoccus sp. TaxID=2706531 RepID=UPI002D7EB168|nr:aromatic ring-hydroxylating dioxygenase subunit alpha [Segeticoccus sp.]HET8599610.1 aromatic ring-hydroxylating dioxygenase subunit alpha [Segeticoccus sp.]
MTETSAPERHTLPGRDYHAPEVYELDRERIFFRSWMYAGRAERLASKGQWMTVDLAGESILLVRGEDGRIRGFYNVCRHRGTRLCEEGEGRARTFLRCPYHAWSYRLDGQLAVTPNIEEDELDRNQLSLWPVHVDTWQGFLFISLDREQPPELRQWLAAQHDEPVGLERFRLDELRIGHISVTEVQANWKIVVENYNECLHCPIVHPELVQLIPAYRRGWVEEDGRADGGVSLAEGRTSVGGDPRSRIPMLPGMGEHEASSYFGAMVFPNMFLDVSGTEALATGIFPTGPTSCRLVTEYLFHAEALADPDFDPGPVVEFNDRVTAQDNDVCERVQRGVRSRAFDHGVFPAKDSYVHAFDQRYLRERDGG